MQQQRSAKELHRNAPDRHNGNEMPGEASISGNPNSGNKPSGGVKRFFNRAFGSNYSKKFLNNSGDKGVTGSRSRSEEDIKSTSRLSTNKSINGSPQKQNHSTFGIVRKPEKYSKPSNGSPMTLEEKEEEAEEPVSVAAVVAALESYQKTQKLDLESPPLVPPNKAVTKTTLIPKQVNMGNSCSYNVKQVPHHNNHMQQAQTLPDLRLIQVSIKL